MVSLLKTFEGFSDGKTTEVLETSGLYLEASRQHRMAPQTKYLQRVAGIGETHIPVSNPCEKRNWSRKPISPLVFLRLLTKKLVTGC